MNGGLLSLVMIIKNESASLKAVLTTAKPYISYYCILDTGSCDGSQEIVRTTLADIPGKLIETAFIGYAETRNLALSLDTSNSVFQINMSADEYVRNGDELVKFLEQHKDSTTDCFKLRLILDEETRFSTPRIFRKGSSWRYTDDGCGVHEYPTNTDPQAPVGTIPDAYIDHVVADPEKRYSNIWENHIPLLESRLEEDPNNARALIFLAQSYETLLPVMGEGERITYAMKAMSLYLRRLNLGNMAEAEQNYLKMRYLTDARLTGVYTPAELFERCKELRELDPHRPETAMLLMYAGAAAELPVVQIYQLAVHAAGVAKAAENIESDSPVSVSMLWKAHHAAAAMAVRLSKTSPDWRSETGQAWADLARAQVKAGIEAGGDWGLFNKISVDLAAAG